jgi:hypothetical protein
LSGFIEVRKKDKKDTSKTEGRGGKVADVRDVMTAGGEADAMLHTSKLIYSRWQVH